jgi:DNA invertase Pin-like site-specific DNA recombinase
MYVAYYRVSTARQGRSGLGLDAQRATVAAHVGGAELVAEFTEIESGKHAARPALADALALCRRRRARLIIAKLDRLSRDVEFIAHLMKSGIEFVACDIPNATPLMLHIFAAVAQHEREMISRRTTEALAAAKARGVQLGNPRPAAAAAQGRAVASANSAAYRATVAPIIAQLHAAGHSQRAIAAELNRRKIPTARGKTWSAMQVGRILAEGHAIDDAA